MTGENLKKKWMEMPSKSFEPMMFGELEDGALFISMPLPGDNSGHGGFRGPHFIFMKTNPLFSADMSQEMNCVRVKDGNMSNMPDTAHVIEVILR